MAAFPDIAASTSRLAQVRSRPGDPTEPLAGSIMSSIVTIGTATILATLITQRVSRVQEWRTLPPVVWIVFAIFCDSWLFVLVTGILKFGVGLSTSFNVCQGAILLCLVCYVTTKILIYIFLVEKAYIIRQSAVPKPRLKSKLYIFNSFGMLGIYAIVSVLNFIFRITRLDNHECIIGMQRKAMIPLITFDILANIYLTILFLLPLRTLYNFRHIQRNAANERLRTVAFRTFIGACSTTVSSIANLSVLMALDGEPGWVCLMCCNLDIAFSAVVVHWVTYKDRTAPFQHSATSAYAKGVVSTSHFESAPGTGSGGVGVGGWPSYPAAGGQPSARTFGSGSGGGMGRASFATSKVLLVNGGCVHECSPGTGCYGSASNRDIRMSSFSSSAGRLSPRRASFGTATLLHQPPPAAKTTMTTTTMTTMSGGHGKGQLNFANVVVDKDGEPVNKAFMTAEAIAAYHYQYHRYMNGGSSNRYPFTKSSSVSGGTLESTRCGETSGRYSEFRKYGSQLFADNIDPLELDDGEEGADSGGEECEYELVLRKKKRPRTPPILPAELDPVVNRARPGAGKWSVAKETTLVVESTAVADEEDEAASPRKLRRNSSTAFGTRTVCLAGGGERHDEQQRKVEGEASTESRPNITVEIHGAGTVAASVPSLLLKKVSKRTSRNMGGATIEDTEVASGSGRSLRGHKKEVSWLDVSAARASADRDQDDSDSMWDGTQGGRSSRVEPDNQLGRFDSQESILQLQLEDV